MAALEHSAGLVAYLPGPPRLYLLLDYGRHWDYPKGHIEPGETPLTAALRELEEETAITNADIHPGFAQEITYYFRGKKSALIRKSVLFYLASIHSDKVTLSHEHVGYAFETYENALRRLTFASARQVLRQAEQFLTAPAAPPPAAPVASPHDLPPPP